VITKVILNSGYKKHNNKLKRQIQTIKKQIIYCRQLFVYVLHWAVVSCFWRRRNKLKWVPFEFFAPSHYCGLEAGSILLRVIVNKKAMRDEGVIYVAGIHYW